MPRKRESYFTVLSKRTKKTGIWLMLPVAALLAFAFYSYPASPSHQGQALVMHIHASIQIFIDGQPVTIPANIGIDSNLWKDRSLERYGMPMPNMPEMPYMSPLHTHDTSGTIHIESTVNREYTLGEFFDLWGVNFNESCILDRCSEDGIIMFVNGVRSYDFRNHILKDEELIRIEFSGK